MQAKHWILTGSGCLVCGLLLTVIFSLLMMNRMQSSMQTHPEDKHTDFLERTNQRQNDPDPGSAFGLIAVAAVSGALLFLAGTVTLIVGFIKLAKEPNPDRAKKDGQTNRPT